MAVDLSDRVRARARMDYVEPAEKRGRTRFSIPVRDLFDSLVTNDGFPRRNVPQVCDALRSQKFLRRYGLEIEKIEGPPSQTSTTVVFHYRFQSAPAPIQEKASGKNVTHGDRKPSGSPIDKIYGLMKEEFAAYGGGEAFLKWLRTDPEKDRR